VEEILEKDRNFMRTKNDKFNARREKDVDEGVGSMRTLRTLLRRESQRSIGLRKCEYVYKKLERERGALFHKFKEEKRNWNVTRVGWE